MPDYQNKGISLEDLSKLTRESIGRLRTMMENYRKVGTLEAAIMKKYNNYKNPRRTSR